MTKDPSVLLLPVAVTVLLLAALVWLVWKVRSWWREDANDAGTDHEILAQYREMHLRGELSEEEYRSIKRQMAARMGMVPDLPRSTRKRMTESAATADSGNHVEATPTADDEEPDDGQG
ncbi:MAG: SHOCT domain-containing protein [Planctomycetales bacterium]|nr:SHOCT domain-containing protein [Planctomycetales bacterium]